MIASDYRLDDNKLVSFAFEFVTDGNNSQELTLGYDQTFYIGLPYLKKVRPGIEISYNFENAAISSGFETEASLFGELYLTAAYNYYDFDTLVGERDIPSLKGGKIYHEFSTRLLLRF